MIDRRPILLAGAAGLLLGPALLVGLRVVPVSKGGTILYLAGSAPSQPPGRALFATDIAELNDTGTTGTPRLVGIVGRVPGDAVALIEGEDGAARSLAVGATIDGWRVGEIGRDRVRLVQGGRAHVAILPPSADAQ